MSEQENDQHQQLLRELVAERFRSTRREPMPPNPTSTPRHSMRAVEGASSRQ